jgi:MFS family permease
VSFAIRASFGVFQIPIAEEFGWLRAEFSLAIAIQNLAWGIGQPLFGAFAERFGDRRAIVLGALSMPRGSSPRPPLPSPRAHQLLEILVGFGIAGTGFGVILAVVGRAAATRTGPWRSASPPPRVRRARSSARRSRNGCSR